MILWILICGGSDFKLVTIVGDYLSSVGCFVLEFCDIISIELFIDMNIECINKNKLIFGGNVLCV